MVRHGATFNRVNAIKTARHAALDSTRNVLQHFTLHDRRGWAARGSLRRVPNRIINSAAGSEHTWVYFAAPEMLDFPLLPRHHCVSSASSNTANCHPNNCHGPHAVSMLSCITVSACKWWPRGPLSNLRLSNETAWYPKISRGFCLCAGTNHPSRYITRCPMVYWPRQFSNDPAEIPKRWSIPCFDIIGASSLNLMVSVRNSFARESCADEKNFLCFYRNEKVHFWIVEIIIVSMSFKQIVKLLLNNIIW